MISKVTIFLSCILIPICTLGQSNNQCDSISLYGDEFDMQFQEEYVSIEADTVLAIRYCGSTNGCANTIGLLCWEVNGELFFNKLERENGVISSNSKLSKKLKKQLADFYNKRIFEIEGELDKQYFIDDGQFTSILFKTPGNCWRFGCGASKSEDERVTWTYNLIEIINK